MKRNTLQYILTFALLFYPSFSWGQSPVSSFETGFPYSVQYYSSETYNAYSQNWSVVEDARGIVYVANRDGILEFDGSRWSLIKTTSNTTVRSLAIGEDQVLYAGLQGEFGYLIPDHQEKLRYVSLLSKVAKSNRDFTDVWGTHATTDGVFFQTNKHVFLWNGRLIRSWTSNSSYHTSFVVRGVFYVREKGVGLQSFHEDSFQLVPGGELFSDQRIYAMMPYPKDQILVGTRENGLYIFDGATFRPLPTEVDSLVSRNRMYHGVALQEDMFAISTLGGGVYIINAEGELKQVLDQTAGMPDNVVTYAYCDRQSNLWLTLNNKGLLRVNVLSPSRFDQSAKLGGTIRDVKRHKKQLFIATGDGKGVYTLEPRQLGDDLAYKQPTFSNISGIPTAWALESLGDYLLAGTEFGIFLINGEQIKKITKDQTVAMSASVYHDKLIYLGNKDGLTLLFQEPSGELTTQRVLGVHEEIRNIVEEDKHTIWLTTRYQGVIRLIFGEKLGIPQDVQRFGDREGVPENRNSIARLNGKMLLFSSMSVMRYVESSHVSSAKGYFYPDTTLMSLLSLPEDSVLNVSEGPKGSLWVVFEDHVKVVRQEENGEYLVEIPEALRFPKGTESLIYPEENGVVWHSKGDVLYRYDPRIQVPKSPPFSTWIRSVQGMETDTLIFGGSFTSKNGTVRLTQAEEKIPALAYADKNLTLRYSTISRNESNENQYQFRLDGIDKQWSAWTPSTSKSYTNLQEGSYQFRVQARNVNGDISTEAAYAFIILPPWYRTWWAYSLYGLSLLSLIIFAGKYRRMVLAQRLAAQQAQELARERLVNKRLQLANERLQQANKLKDEFLATTSHELRTPLTAILGYTAVVKEEVPEETGLCEFLEIIEQNGNRLMQTLNSLLDLAKLRAGTLEMHPKPVDLAQHTAEVVSKLAGAATRKNLFLELIPPQRALYANLDFQALERVLNNLVDNAIKFTETGGVTLHCSAEGKYVKIHVQDTGIGIDARFLPELFDEFKQESDGPSRSYEGSGLGLAITAQLVRLMEGVITVESEKGRGSVFTVSFPIYTCQPDISMQLTPANRGRSRATWQPTA